MMSGATTMATQPNTLHVQPTVVFVDEHLQIDELAEAVLLDSQRLVLTRKEYQLLSTLARNAGRVMPREYLLEKIWNYGNGIRTRTLDVHIRRLRRKLGSLGDRYIETVFGVGYRFRTREERVNDRFLIMGTPLVPSFS
jgi:DNA-binding response OmpR family regulator